MRCGPVLAGDAAIDAIVKAASKLAEDFGLVSGYQLNACRRRLCLARSTRISMRERSC